LWRIELPIASRLKGLGLLLSLLVLLVLPVDKDTNQRTQSTQYRDQAVGAVSQIQQSNATDNSGHCNDKPKNRAKSLVMEITFNNPFLELLTVCALTFGHSQDALGSVGNSIVVLSEKVRLML
jgi:hypothetical protein